MRAIGWIFATALSLFFVLGPVGVAGAQSYEPEELAFLEEINAYRQQNGLGPLELSDTLSVASERHSEDMGTYGFFSHTTQGSSYYPVGSGHADRISQEGYPANAFTAENLAYGQTTAAEVFEAWRVSAGHNANMLGDYSVIGIGLVTTNGTPYWTTVFGSIGGEPTPATSDTATPDTTAPDAATPGAATPEAAPDPATDEVSEQPAAGADRAAAPEPGGAAAEQYAADDQYEAGTGREAAPEASPDTQPDTEPTAEPQRAAVDQYSEAGATPEPAGREAASETAPAATVGSGPAQTANDSEDAVAEDGGTGSAEPEKPESSEQETAGEADTPGSAPSGADAPAGESSGTGAAKADGATPSDPGFAASAGIAVLPDTGGAPLLPLVGGAGLLVGGFLARRVF